MESMINIRTHLKQDDNGLWKLKYDTIRNINTRDYSLAQVKSWAPTIKPPETWAARISAMQPFVAEINGQIVGFADLQSDGYIDHFFCHVDFQGQGVGNALMNRIFEQAQEDHLERLYSQVSITAKPFFEHFGFEVIKQQQVDVRGQVLINYLMALSFG